MNARCVIKFVVQILLMLVGPTLHATTIFAPPSGLLLSNCIPLSGCGDSDRYQQLYAPSIFSSLATPEYITEVAFRPAGDFKGPASFTLSNVEVGLSTFTRAALSTMFDDNVGADASVVYAGPLTLETTFLSQPTANFDFVIELMTPFLYDPSLGGLLLQFKNIGGESAPTGFRLGFHLNANLSRVTSPAGGGAQGATGIVDTGQGLATRFVTTQFLTTSTLPEPPAILLFGISTLILARFRTQRSPPI